MKLNHDFSDSSYRRLVACCIRPPTEGGRTGSWTVSWNQSSTKGLASHTFMFGCGRFQTQRCSSRRKLLAHRRHSQTWQLWFKAETIPQPGLHGGLATRRFSLQLRPPPLPAWVSAAARVSSHCPKDAILRLTGDSKLGGWMINFGLSFVFQLCLLCLFCI